MDSDEIAISYFTDLAGDGVRIDYSVEGNPFRFRTSDELFQDRAQTNQRLRLEEESSKKYSLIQRTEMTRPHVPPFETRATLIHSSMSGRQKLFSSLSKKNFNPSQSQPNITNKSLNQPKDTNLNTKPKKQSLIQKNSRPQSVYSKVPLNDKSSNSDDSQTIPVTSEYLNLSPFSSSRTTTRESAGNNDEPETKPKTRERKLTMHEFVDEKREIYRLQLFIDKKNKDIKKFSRNMNVNNRKLQEAESKIKSLAEEYKMTSIQMEAAVARSRKLADEAARETSLKKKELLKLKANCDMLESDFIKKEATLEAYQTYRKFLEIFVPQDSSLEKFFTSPDILIDEIEKIETETLFIIQECQHISGSLKSATTNVQKELQSTLNLCDNANERLNSIEKVEDFDGDFSPEQEKSVRAVEDELQHIQELIRKTYSSCLSQDVDLKPITMLERIENKLEMMYMLLAYVDPAFIEEKQAIKLRIRREIQRKLKQEKRELEQKLKTEQAIERARKPIPQKVGRQINQRIIPIRAKIHDDEKEKAKLRELERERKLLYGDIE